MSLILGSLAAMVAVVDWWAVRVDHRDIEQVAKPLVIVALIGLALTLDAQPPAAQWLVVAGLGFGLVGDVLLLPRVNRLVPALVAFLVGHGLYIAAFSTMDLAFIGIVGGVAASAVVMVYLGVPILRAVRTSGLRLPVVAYMVVVCGVITMATATHRWPLAIGGVVFGVSDGLLGHHRFVRSAPQWRFVVHILYHLGQAGFVLGLVA